MALFDRGPQGPAGPPGNGSAGTSFLTGTVTPDSALGSVGDHYVNTGASPPLLYGPKTLGGWGDPTELGGVGTGISVSGTGFVHATGGSIDSVTKKVDLSAAADITNTLGVPNGGTGKTTSDLSGQAGKAVVVNGTNDGFSFQSFPSGSAVPTGNGFRKIVSGSEQSTAAAVNLASGTDVTGVLPRANQQSQNLTGDVVGTTAASVVNAIQNVVITGTAVSGYLLTATSPTAATWQASGGGGGGSGEANTYSTSGGTYAWTRTKSGVDLPFKGLSVSPPFAIGDNSTFINISLLGISGWGGVGQSFRVAASGNSLEWYTPSSGGGSTSPGGSSGQLQINSAGSFGGLAFGTANYLLAMNSSANGYVWVAPSGGGSSSGASGVHQMSNGSGGFSASSINEDSVAVRSSKPRLGNGSPFASEGVKPISVTSGTYTLASSEYSYAALYFGSAIGSGVTVTAVFPNPADDDHAYFKWVYCPTGIIANTGSGGSVSAHLVVSAGTASLGLYSSGWHYLLFRPNDIEPIFDHTVKWGANGTSGCPTAMGVDSTGQYWFATVTAGTGINVSQNGAGVITISTGSGTTTGGGGTDWETAILT